MNYRYIIWTARIFSFIFRPFYMPLVSLIGLFTYTYLLLLPPTYKLGVITLVAGFTWFLPQILIYIYQRITGITDMQLRLRHQRSIPYLLSIISYGAGLYTMNAVHLPHYMGGLLISALMVQITCALINTRWKICIHSASAGGLTGTLIAYSVLFMFNPVWWLCLTILISGIVGSSRMILRQHTLSQVLAGTAVGVICGCAGILIS
ncbi:MAG: phosphatase PAP2 family protein [Clostridium sp.]|nr:phosphatase PAP2 family protein [Clostridium sp.]